MSAYVDLRARLAPLAAAADVPPVEAYFTMHGDPYIVEAGRGFFGHIASMSTASADYGRALTEFVVALVNAYPAIDALLARGEAAEALARRSKSEQVGICDITGLPQYRTRPWPERKA